MLTFATRPIRGFAYAADRDQARLLRDAMQTLTRLNPLLGSTLSIESFRVKNIADSHPGRDGELSIESSDAASSWGVLPDLIIADELTHWPGDGTLWHSLVSSAAKRANCLFIVIANAGVGQGTSWQWTVRENARTSPDWYFSRLDGPKASWITEKTLAEQKRLLPDAVYRRLWMNQWSTGGGDALDAADIEAAVTLDGPMWSNLPGHSCIAGLDLGVKRDHSAFVVLACDHSTARVKLAWVESWKPTAGESVNLERVRMGVLTQSQRLGITGVFYDPWQCEYLAQRLRKTGCVASRSPLSGRT